MDFNSKTRTSNLQALPTSGWGTKSHNEKITFVCIFSFFPVLFNLVRYLKRHIHFMHTHFIQRTWTCTPLNCYPLKAVFVCPVPQSMQNFKFILLRNFVHSCSLGRDLVAGGRGEGGERQFSKQWGKTVQNFHHQWPWRCWSQRKQHHPTDSMRGNHSETNKQNSCIYFYRGSLCQASFGEIQISPALASSCCW